MEVILQGIIGGLLLSVLIGPVFMYLIEVSITKGIKEALFVDLGVFISDLTAIVLSFIFLNQLKFLQEEKAITGIIAGSIFVIFGIGYLFKSPKSVPEGDDVGEKVKIVTGKHLLMDVAKGFLLNMVNPSVIVYWLGVMIVAVDNYGRSSSDIFVFFTALLLTFFSIDVLKIIGAAQLKRFLSPKVIDRINLFSGFGFIILGTFSLIMGLLKL